MVVIIPDDKIRNVKLTGDELTLIIEALEYQSHSVYKFFNYEEVVKKLKQAKK